MNLVKHPTYTLGQLQLSNDLRKLWEELAMWIRFFIISFCEEIPDIEHIKKRLEKNANTFGELFSIFYNKNSGKAFKELLIMQTHILENILSYINAKDKEKADEAIKSLYKNADDIANYFSSINPYLNNQEWKELLNEFIRLILNEITLRLSKAYADDIVSYDQNINLALDIADNMTGGFIQYFDIK